ncbi:MAG: hypothetical protein QM759_07415 [Terricaulis sp.]
MDRVRILSFAASLTVVAAAIASFALYRVSANIDEGLPAIAIPAFVEDVHPTRATDAPPPPPQHGVPDVAANPALSDRDNSLRLWRYGAHNEIVFSYAEQFDRCTDARKKHIDQPDCPSARETRDYVLLQTGDAPLVLAYRRH